MKELKSKIEDGIRSGEIQSMGAGIFIGAFICLVLGALAPLLGIEWWNVILFTFGAPLAGVLTGVLMEFTIQHHGHVLAPFSLMTSFILPIGSVILLVAMGTRIPASAHFPYGVFATVLGLFLWLGLVHSKRFFD